MSWVKSIELDSGVTVSYWKIEKASFDVVSSSLGISYQGYKDEAAYLSGKIPLVSKDVTVAANTNLTLAAAVLAHCQGIIVALPEFDGAVEE